MVILTRGDERGLLAALSLDDKVRLLTGADNWRTCPLPAIGLRAMVVSDGPAGVRGVTMDERNPSSSLPCPSALGATWDPGLVPVGLLLARHDTALDRPTTPPSPPPRLPGC